MLRQGGWLLTGLRSSRWAQPDRYISFNNTHLPHHTPPPSAHPQHAHTYVLLPAVFQDGVKALVEKGYKKITPFFIPYAITNMGKEEPPLPPSLGWIKS